MRNKVLVPIANGIEEIEAIAVVDALRRAGADVTVASVGELQITAAQKTKVIADTLLKDCKNISYDLIVLPGGPGAGHLRDCKDLIALLKAQQQAGKLYAAICASPVVILQHHGLLKDKKATCHPSMWNQLVNCSKERVVVDGNCVTSQGPGPALEFAIKLIELLFNRDRAIQVAQHMVI